MGKKKIFIIVAIFVLGFLFISGGNKKTETEKDPVQTGTQEPVTGSITSKNPIVWQHCSPSEKVQCDVWIMNPDGTGQTNLTPDTEKSFDFDPQWSADRSKIVFSSTRAGNSNIFVMDADGTNVKQLTTDPNFETFASFSPDGKEIVFARTLPPTGKLQIHIMNADGSNVRRLTTSSAEDEEPAFSPDGKKILFDSNKSGAYELYVMDRDGTNIRQLTQNVGDNRYPAWSPDGSKIVFGSDRDNPNVTEGLGFEVYTINADGSNPKRLTTISALPDADPIWSPDGSHIAFTSAREGEAEIYIMNADGSDQKPLTKSPAFDAGADW